MKRPAALARLSAIAMAVACGRQHAPSSTALPAETEDEAFDAVAPMDSREAAQWQAAAEGDAEELMRLEDLVGCRGLRERSAESKLRIIAVRAMQYCPDFSELPWLARVATEGSDADSRAALETIDLLAARPRRSIDPEDADELHAGCGELLALAGETSRPKDRRMLAVRALRMLGDRGCGRLADAAASGKPD